MALEHDNSMMENLYWWGVPTLFRCPQEKVLGRPASVFQKSDGSILISDDGANVIYRVSYQQS